MLVRNPVHKENQKIIMLIPNLDFGGAQRVFHDHAKVLTEKYEVTECVFNLNHGHAYPTGNRLLSLEVPGGVNVVDKVYRFLQRCWRLYKLKRKEKPCITISHLEGADYVNVLSFGVGKKILVVHGSKIHDQEIDHSYGWIRKKLLLPILYKQADLIVTVSEGIKHELISQLGLSSEKIITIYNFFSIQKLTDLAEKDQDGLLSIKRNSYRLITSGRLANQKNQISLLYIIKEMKEKHKIPICLYFAGDGPLKQILFQECHVLNLTFKESNHMAETDHADIVFLGFQENPFQYYKDMDLFVFPSAWEGFPMALGEAMALGLPVVSADCPTGPLELLQPDWQEFYPVSHYPLITPLGVLLPIPKHQKKETIGLWADTIAKMLQDRNTREALGQAASKRMQCLDQEVMKEKWLTIDRLINA